MVSIVDSAPVRKSPVATPRPPRRPRPVRKYLWRMTAAEKAGAIGRARSDALEALEQARKALGSYAFLLGMGAPVLALAGLERGEAAALAQEAAGGKWLAEKLIVILGAVPYEPTADERAEQESKALALMEADGFAPAVADAA